MIRYWVQDRRCEKGFMLVDHSDHQLAFDKLDLLSDAAL